MTLQKLLNGETDDRGSGVDIETDGNILRPWFNTIHALVDECRIHADADGVHVRAVGPSNVGYVDTRIYPEAFDAYDLEAGDEYRTGVNTNALASAASIARKGATTTDPLTLSFDGERHVTLETERDYSSTTVERGRSLDLIDPASIRAEPDIVELDMTIRGEVDTLPFRDVLDGMADYAEFVPDGDDLVVAEDLDTEASAARFRDVLSESPDDADPTVFSLDYLQDMASAIRDAKADTVEVLFAPEIPMRLRFERTNDDGDVLYDGSYLLAPRISTD